MQISNRSATACGTGIADTKRAPYRAHLTGPLACLLVALVALTAAPAARAGVCGDRTPSFIPRSNGLGTAPALSLAASSPTPIPTARPDGSRTAPATTIPTGWETAADGATLVTVNAGGANVVFMTRGASGWVTDQVLPSVADPSSDEPEWGRDVDVQGDLAVVAGFYEMAIDSTTRAGKAYVYRRTAGVWALEACLEPPAADPAFYGFGCRVAVSGDSVLVAAPYATLGGHAEAGAAYVYSSAGGVWTREARLTATTPEGGDRFGWSVALDADLAVVGAPQADTPAASFAGTVGIFRRAGGAWQREAEVAGSDPQIGGDFGYATAVSGGTILVGARGRDFGEGAAFTFEHGPDGWRKAQRLTASDGENCDSFGETVDIVGDTAIIGAPRTGDFLLGKDLGAAHVFRRLGATWFLDADLTVPLGGPVVGLGFNVVIAEGDLLVRSESPWALQVYSPYSTGVGESLTVNAVHGVLANDVAPALDTLRAELVDQPSHGAVTLNADGSFAYAPESAFTGTDTLTYRAVGATWSSEPTPVEINVRDLTAPTVSVGGIPSGWVDQPVTVVLGPDGRGAAACTDYRRHARVDWTLYVKPFRVSREGATEYEAHTHDIHGNVSARRTFSVRIDTHPPSTRAAAAQVVRGRRCTLRYRVDDPRPGSPTATATIHMLNSRGQEQWSVAVGRSTVNTWHSYTFVCRMTRGTHNYRVTAKDAAGNVQARAARATLVVK